jgi:cell division protein ZipA
MQFFHRYESANGDGAVQFSVANILNPGTFDLDNIDSFESPGVSFFMCVPGPANPLQAYDFMVETAQCLVKNLDGELLDETRSAMTKQTLEHSRQRVIDSERRRLAQHA